MKNITITIIFSLILTLAASAQISKGTIMVGPTLGTTSYSSATDNLDYTSGNNINKNTTTKTFGLSIGPQVGVFLTDHFVLGGSLTYNITYKNSDATTTSYNNHPLTANANTTNYTFNIGPFVRYYFYQTLSRNLFYLQVNGTVGSGNGNSSGNGINTNSTYTSDGRVSGIFNFNTSASFGLTHFFNDFVGMDFAIGYSYASVASNNVSNTHTSSNNTGIVTTNTNDYNETLITNGITLGLGFHWFLHK